jgi:hypothetical protein
MKVFLLVTAVFCLFLEVSAVSSELNRKEIEAAINEMLISDEFSIVVKKIFVPLNDVQLVYLDPPYREFPSIIIFKKKPDASEWVRTIECLSPGIQAGGSKLKDWHTEGLAADFTVGGNNLLFFDSDIVKFVIETFLAETGSFIVPYRHFFHMHTAASAIGKKSKPYTIDKTGYFDFANHLFAGKYKNLPFSECTMYDTPYIVECEFYMERGKYTVKARTSNGQIWIYRFSGVDEDYKYLLDKEIEVKNTP